MGFWASSISFQYLNGIVGIHAGRSIPVTTVFGLASVCSSIALSNCLTNTLIPPTSVEKSRIYKLKNVLIGLPTFALMENCYFRTALPSSILSIGVFGKRFMKQVNSIPATSAVATSAQRLTIQSFGRFSGCHQCGNHQIFSKLGFIADHMPPTKFAIERSQSFWRKLFNKPVNYIQQSLHFLNL